MHDEQFNDRYFKFDVVTRTTLSTTNWHISFYYNNLTNDTMATGLTMATMKTTTDVDVDSIIELLFQQQPLSSSNGLSYYNYGTAGFRFKANVMDGLMVRVGILSILLLLKQAEEVVPTASGTGTTTASTTSSIITTLSTGIMITASHNDESYNGVKLANPDGSMLVPIQEEFLTKWVNESNSEEWKQLLNNEKLVFKLKNMILKSSSLSLSLSLHIGRDTRSHSFHLSKLLCLGAQTFIDYLLLSESKSKVNIIICDHEVLTTPMLHHIVLHSNSELYLPSYIEPKPTRTGYIETYATAYIDLCVDLCVANANANVIYANGVNADTNANVNTNQQQTVLRIDSACGVGYDAVKELEDAILNRNKSLALITTLNAQNGPHDGPLNDSCGSDHVKTLFLPPTWWKQMNKDKDKDNNKDEDNNQNDNYNYPYCCSIDGDADRIVFFGQTSKNELSEFLDGDKIAILIAHVLQDKLSKTKTKSNSNNSTITPIPTMGIIQTAYANGAATNYVRDVLKLPVIITKTGVKHLHHAAVEIFDIGIYFEANGHGTVVFSKQYEQFAILQQQQQLKDSFYIGLHRLINPAVGDALCDMLLVDYLLRSLRTNDNGAAAGSSSSSSSSSSWTLQDWNTKLYQDLPNRMLKVKVKDRTIIKCNSNESICLQPLTVQPLLEKAMNVTTNGIENGRCFIRPSGTEDIVRVYAEAKTRTDADKLALIASQIVYDECNGIGERP